MNIMTSVKTVRYIQDLSGNVVGTVTVSKPKKHSSQAGKLKKRIPYNFKEISTQILQSKKSSAVAPVVVRARGKIVNLKRKLKTGEYDDTELTAAILHAERILRVAKKRLKNMQAEERAQKGTSNPFEDKLEEDETESSAADLLRESDDFELSSEEIEELIKKIQEEMPELLEDDELTELSDDLKFLDNMEPEDLEQLKKKHRSDEYRDIVRADMKYLKALFDKLAKDKQEASSAFSGVSLELGGSEVPVQSTPMPAMVEGATVDETV